MNDLTDDEAVRLFARAPILDEAELRRRIRLRLAARDAYRAWERELEVLDYRLKVYAQLKARHDEFEREQKAKMTSAIEEGEDRLFRFESRRATLAETFDRRKRGVHIGATHVALHEQREELDMRLRKAERCVQGLRALEADGKKALDAVWMKHVKPRVDEVVASHERLNELRAELDRTEAACLPFYSPYSGMSYGLG